ncbi:MAG: DUF1800 domain-containing protein [Thermoanaerobaculia bacterium]
MAIAWDRVRAAHLFRRAAFGATPADIERALDEGLEATVDRLLDLSVPNDALDARLARQTDLDLTKVGGILRWWAIRLVWSARPLEERMTLFLHDHFATAISKVGQPEPMLEQNQLLRRHALGNFTTLTTDIARDTAMLIWLDNRTNVKDHPNENFGRELLELFLLGHGNYSEEDVASAAKAFTGWTISRQTRRFIFVDRLHDHSQKTFLGRTGDWDGDDIVRMACDEEAHARFLAEKLYFFFVHEHAEESVLERFANVYRDAGTELKPLVRAILTSEEMYSEHVMWSKVKSPADHAITALRQLAIDDDRAARVAGTAMAAEGQTLFNPPDVAGWDGGMQWINSASLLTRMNFGAPLLNWFDPARFLEGSSWSTAAELVDVYLDRLGPLDVPASTHAALEGYVAPGGALPSGSTLTWRMRGLAQMVISLPEWQKY